MMLRLSRATSILVCLLSTLGAPLLAWAQASATYFVTDVDAASFPQVQFSLRAVDLSNQPVSGLSTANASVFENGQPAQGVALTPHTDGPINIIFVIDQGRNANYTSFGLNNVRQILTTLVSGGYFVDGRDTVRVLARQNVNSDQTVEVLPATRSAAEFTTWVANFNFQRGSGATKGLLGVEDAITRMSELVPVPGSQTAAIIYLTRFVEDPSRQVAVTAAQNTAAGARQNYISIYTFHTDLNRTYQDALQVLAEGTYGQYAALNRSNLDSAVSNVYQAIAAQRTYYTVGYRSVIGTSGTRQITVNSAERPSTGTVGQYEITLQPPSVNITQPMPNTTLRREARLSADNTTFVFDTNSVNVTAEVAWTDGYPRELRSAQLFVDGTLEDMVQVGAGQTSFAFTWDITNVVTEGANASTLEVKVADELGVEAAAASGLTVEVIIPLIPTPTPTPVAVPSAVWIGVPVLCVVLAGAVLLGGVLVYVFRSRGRQPAAAVPASSAQVQNTIVGGIAYQDKVLATLTVMEGPKGLIGEPLKIVKPTTVMGRNPKVTDISFYADEESSVSRLHCTLQLDYDKSFKLTDNGSSSGTRLNGRQIQPNDPVVLADGDEIVLGDLARRGVKVRFNLTLDQEQSRYAGSADDRTHIISTPEEDNWDKYADS